jgi:hypothetical protein
VTSPNEPGSSEPGDGQGNRNGLPDRGGAPKSPAGPGAGRATEVGSETGAAPQRQRGANRSRQNPHRPTPEPTTQQEPRSPDPPDVGARAPRFISGTAAPSVFASASPGHATAAAEESESSSARSGGRHTEAYASELPDLSEPLLRPAQRKTAPERGTDVAPTPGASRSAASESRAHVPLRRARGPVRASMQIRRIDPWSTMKVSLILSVALFFVWMIAVAFLYLVLGGMGVWSKLNSNVGDLLTNTGGGGNGELVSSGTIFGGAVLIGLVDIVLLTAMATVGAFIYNLTTDLIGGIEVTLADRD